MKKLIIILSVLSILMLGCTDASRELINRKVPSQNKVIEINDTDKQFYTREEESEELKDPYGLVHLKKHEVYKVKEDIFIDLYFNDEVKEQKLTTHVLGS